MEASHTRRPVVYLLIYLWLSLCCLHVAQAKASPENTASPIQIQLVTSLAKSGRADAQYKLGVMYLSGYNVEKDINSGLRWLQMAADQGHGEAQNRLGLMHLNGTEIKRDCHSARQWFSRVTNDSKVYQQAQSNLAWLLATCPDATDRDGQQALKIARQLIAEQKTDNPSLLDTLAAALAETGQFQQAVTTQQQAIALLEKHHPASRQHTRFSSRLKSYQLQHPWRLSDGQDAPE